MISVKRIAEHDEEPQLGLPAPLPSGERLLWQGRPDWRTMARHALHVRAAAAYLGLLIAYYAGAKLLSGVAPAAVALAAAQFGAVAAALCGFLAAYAWGTSRAALYTITDKRLVLRFGLVVPVTFNIPFGKIASASLNTFADGAGDVAILLESSERIGYFILWPHARPWRMKRAEPTLRGIPDAERVARTLARALAGSAAMPVAASAPAKTAAARPSAALA